MKNSGSVSGNKKLGMGLVRSTSFGRRKRVAFTNDDSSTTPCKKTCSRNDENVEDEIFGLEDMPQEILIRILCGVEHDDLKSLIFVSKAISEATLIAKQSHFAYSTPRKTLSFRNVNDFGEFSEIEAPNAPKQSRVRRSRLSGKKMADISVSLFASDELVSDLGV